VLACLTSMAALVIHQDKPVLAARLIGIVESRLKSLSINLLYLDKVELEQTRNQLQDHLDKATYSNAFSEGWEMNEERAMELVREVLNEG